MSFFTRTTPTTRFLSFQFPRGDTLIAGLVPLGLAGLLIEAYFRTEIPQAQASSDCAYEASSRLIQGHHVRQLQDEGMIVLEGAIAPQLLVGARRDLFQLLSENNNNNDSMCSMSESANANDVRQDRILWVAAADDDDDETDSIEAQSRKTSLTTRTNTRNNNNDDNDDNNNDFVQLSGDSLIHCLRLIRGISHALVQEGYASKEQRLSSEQQASPPPRYRVPPQGQLALYPGDGQALYRRHLDTCTSTMAELGLLEWLRLSDYRARSLTVILYLNHADRSIADGGALRCWRTKTKATTHDDGAEEDTWDVLPRGGTMVIFQSDKIEHMVLPSTADRYALTSWVFHV